MSDPSSSQASSSVQHPAAPHMDASHADARGSASRPQPRRSRVVAVVATALSGLLVTTGLVSLAVNAAAPAKAATYTPYSGSTTINALSQSAVQTAFNNWYTPTTTVPINWTQPSNCLAGSGSNDAATSQSGLDAVNFYRAMAGLPAVTDYPAGDSYDQAAVTMIEGAGGGIAYEQANPDPHHPASTATCYTSDGAAGTAASDLDFGTAGVASSAAAWVSEWIDDFGTNNVQELGHRRWVLNPPTTSMGMAYGPTSAALGVMSPAAEGSSDTTTTDVAWPSAGYFPYELLPAKSNQWSYSIPGADFSNAAVTVTKNGTAYPVTVQTLLSGYGQSTISWILGSAPARPAYGSTDDYHVAISGIEDANGEALPNVGYDVNLFNASLGGGSVSIAPTTAGQTLAQGTSMTAATTGFPAGTSLSYQWNDVTSAGTTPIAGATSSTYTPTASDAGQFLSVTVTAALAPYPTATITSSTTADYVPYLRMTGPGGVGVAVTSSGSVGVPIVPSITGTPNGATISYSWTNAAGTVVGTDSSYTPTLSDANTTITLNITITAPGYLNASAAPQIKIGAAALAGTVSIVGTLAVGSTLTATPASFPSGTTYSYQWYTGPISGVTPITGATGATYTPVAGDLGKYLDVQITATNAGFSNSPYQNATQSQTVVALGTFSGSVTVTGASGTPSGTAQVGDTLTATPSGYPSGTAYAYQWYQGSTPISGATSATYTVATGDAGQSLSVQLGVSLAGYTSTTVPSATTPVALMTMSGSVSISGTPAFGNVLTATTSGFPAGAALSYQWSSNGSPISGATSSTYTPVVVDVGNSLTVTVNATAAGYNLGTATSAKVTVAEQTMSGTVSVSGTAAVGQTVTAQTTSFPSGATLSYQWYLGATPISGATDSTYTIAPTDSGQNLSVTVTASASGYTTATVPSSAVNVGALTMSGGSVSIPETAVVGTALTATPSGFPVGATYTYQWFSGSTAITGATASTYTPATTDAGAVITVQLTASATGYNSQTVTSNKSNVALLTMSGSVSISGTAGVGSPLTATPSGFPAGATYTYQWFSGGTAISGATTSAYTPVAADAGQKLTVQVAATATGYTTGTATSDPVSVPLQTMNGTVSVSGTAVVGNTLTANPSAFPAGATFTYQWFRGSTPISGATSSTYALVAADAGQSLTVQVTTTATGYSQGTATSTAVSVPLLVMVGTVSITGTAAVGSALTANPAGFPTGASFTYQWFRGPTPISGATSSTYTLVAADAGQSVSVQVAASATGYSPQTVPSSAVTVAAQTMPGSVSVTGTPAVGNALTASLTGFPTGATFTYQWYRGAAPIAGATSATYTPVAADAGQILYVQITATASGYTTATVSSSSVTVSLQTMSGSVSVTGTPAVGSTLTASLTGFPTGATYAYQWLSGGTAISGATAATYTPVAADAGASITVSVTAAASGYSSATVSSSAVSVPLQTMSGSVSVSGTAAVGNTLTANPSGFPNGATFTYQWSLGSTAIGGATSSTYTPVTGDGGQSITVQVVADAAGYTSQTVTSPAVTVANQVSSGTVTVSGTAAVGSTLTATPSGFSGSPAFTYQWYRGATAIAGATAATYALVAADAGQSVSVQVTATATGYTTVTGSSQPVSVAAQAMNGTVSVSGTAVVGNTLTANPSGFPAGASFTYQWYRGAAPIAGATSATYTPVSADAGQKLTVQVTASATGYATATVTSTAVTVSVAIQNMSGAVTISGTGAVGSTLTAGLSGFPGGASFSYQWNRSGIAISGATGSSYTLQVADAGQPMTVTVTATASGYNTDTVSSSPITVATQAMSGTVSISGASSGAAAVGTTLTATPVGFPVGASYTYQWYRDSTAINGATAATYTTQTADAGHTVSAKIAVTATGYTPATASSASVTVTTGNLTMSGTVTISGAPSGTATVGTTLTAVPSGFPAGASYTYQWYQGSTGAISGATSSTYTLQAADSGQLVVVKITATATGYNPGTASSAPVTVAVQQNLTMTGTVAISGSQSGYAAIGVPVTANLSGFTAAATYSYQWYRGSTAISGATGTSYTPVKADSGSSLSVQITATASGYTTASATSATIKVAATQAAVTRIAGVDRYATANAAAQSMYPNGASTVFLMDGLNFPDALAAAPAAAKLGAPILLTQPNTLTGSTLAELNKLKPKTVYVLGQTPSVSAATFAQVQSQVGTHPKVIRIGGSDRFVTSQMLASTVWGSNAKTVFVATGMDYTDGEAAAAAAAKAGAPLLLVNGSLSSGSVISSAVANQLKTWKPTTIHVVGDTANLTPAVYNALASTGATIDRTSGTTPAATAIAVAQKFFGTSSQAFIATDDAGAFSDALVAGALAGKAKGPVLFSDDSLSAGVAGEVLALGASKVTVMGNDLRISTASIQALQQAIGATTSIS